jgi:hypothetical protein
VKEMKINTASGKDTDLSAHNSDPRTNVVPVNQRMKTHLEKRIRCPYD